MDPDIIPDSGSAYWAAIPPEGDYGGDATSAVSTNSLAVGAFTIVAQKTFEIQHRCTTTKTGNGLGVKGNLGEAEVYTIVEIRRVE